MIGRRNVPRYEISSFHRPMTWKLGQHEAGHYIVARALEFQVGQISLLVMNLTDLSHQGGSEITLCQGLRSLSEVEDYLERRVQVLLAGVLAETLENGRTKLEDAQKAVSGMVDVAKAKDLIQLLRNIRHPEAKTEKEISEGLERITMDLWEKTALLVEQDQDIICGLGRRLGNGLCYTGEPFVLTEDELKNTPNIMERFGLA